MSFYAFDPNPQLNDLTKGIEKFNAGKFEIIIAIGIVVPIIIAVLFIAILAASKISYLRMLGLMKKASYELE